ncbi:MFS transporter [Nocardia tengchongensis]|uniref:MFS transporter n=1 Tax=Nocardia tengchongensis TaxID=2055889 RepID=UPI0036A078E5
MGCHGVRITYPLLVLAVTGSPGQAGVVTFAMSVPSLIFQIPAGLAAGYADRKWVLRWCQIAGLMATCIALAAVGRGAPGAVALLSVTAFLEGTANVFFEVSEPGVVRDVVSVAQRPAALAFLEGEVPVMQLIGRAVGAAVFDIARWLPFALNALSYLCCLATLFVMCGEFSARASQDSAALRRTWNRIV